MTSHSEETTAVRGWKETRELRSDGRGEGTTVVAVADVEVSEGTGVVGGGPGAAAGTGLRGGEEESTESTGVIARGAKLSEVERMKARRGAGVLSWRCRRALKRACCLRIISSSGGVG